MKRKALFIGFGIAILSAGGAWSGWQHHQETERVKAAEIKRLADEAQANAEAEAARVATEAAQKAEAEARKPRVTNEAPADPVDGPHFIFSHYLHERVGYDYGEGDRPPLYTHILCNDGMIQAMSFASGWIQPRYKSYDFYKARPLSDTYDQVCLGIRKEDVSTYKTISVPSNPPRPAKDCSETEKTKILSLTGRAKDTIRWCQFQNETDSLGFLQAVTKNGKNCEINSWLVSGDRLLSIGGDPYKGEYRIEEGSKNPATCIFPLGDGDFPEKSMIQNGGPMHADLIFELGQKTYIVLKSYGSEGATSTLYQLRDHKLEEITSYYNYTIDHDFWRSVDESRAESSK